MNKKAKIILWSLFYVFVVTLIFITLSNPKSMASNELRLVLDGQDITDIAEPIIQNDRTLVPIRFIAEKMGAKVTWNNDDRTVKVEKDDMIVILKIDSHLVMHQNEVKSYILCDVPPTIINERTFVPLRLVSNALGVGIEWDKENIVNMKTNELSEIESFFDLKITSLQAGQVVTGKTELQIELPIDEFNNAIEVKYMLLDPHTFKGSVIARGTELSAKYTWIPNLEESGERVLVAAIYNNNGQFLAGDSLLIDVEVKPEVVLNGLEQYQTIDGTVSLFPDVNFVSSYVKYEITNLDNGKVTLSKEADPYGEYNWTPMLEDNGNYSFKAIAYDNSGQAYESPTVKAKVEVARKLKLSGIKNGSTIEKPVTLIASRNFNVSETEYILKDTSTGKEETLAKMGYGSYKWFPDLEYKGTKELLVRVKDTKGIIHESDSITVDIAGTPMLFIEGIGPKQAITGSTNLKVSSNAILDKVKYIFINSETGLEKIIESNSMFEATFAPDPADEGSWKLYAEGITDSNKKILSEEIPFTIYLGETYSSRPITEKDKFLELASELSRDSWRKTGMSAALQTAQAILETGWGQSVPVDKYNGKLSNNLFGIKGSGTIGSVISNTWEEYNGKAFRVDAEFRAYNNIEESWADHKSLLLTKSRYEPFREVMHDSTLGAWAIRRAGYATDSQYPIKLMRIIEQYNLKKLDEISI